MSDVWAPGIGRWFRDRALPRVTARLCAAAILLNMFAPILWAAATPAPAADAPIVCHDTGTVDPTGHAGDPVKPIADHAPHCPLCVLFGGTAWAPPATASILPTVTPQSVAATALRGEALPRRAPRPASTSPRAPPALI
ncbi:MAG: DUF2946 family protein [Pseudomonadota bacterium]